MKTRRIFAIALGMICCGVAYGEKDVDKEIAMVREKAGGIYYAYDVESDSVAPVPDGFTPVYISHYGRHGSRWPVKQGIYKEASGFFQDQQLAENLTQKGKDVWKLVNICAANATGHLGELTPKGARQHRAIAERMANRWPELFSAGSAVEARSSVEPRCIMSMMAFCDRLKEIDPSLKLTKYASPGDMDFIHYSTPEAKAMSGEDAPWMWEFSAYRDSVAMCPNTAMLLFKTMPENNTLGSFMRSLYDIAISVQDIDSLEADILNEFDINELSGLWKASNYMQYAGNAKSPVSLSAGAECSRKLLGEIVGRADEMLSSGDVKVDLRFGHDTDLLRLVSLIDLDGSGVELEDPEEVALRWRNYHLSPMGANLQLIFYRNEQDEVIVQPRLNERPVAISDVPQVYSGYYDWEILKTYFNSL